MRQKVLADRAKFVDSEPMHYKIRCLKCNAEYTDNRLHCDHCPDSLLRTEYENKKFTPALEEPGIFKFRHWLPVSGSLPTKIGPSVFAAPELGEKLGLKNLHVAFNGYWPEREAFNLTGSFKDHEAAPTIVYFRDHGIKDIILSSVGNTARAFGTACGEFNYDCYIVIPEFMIHRLWFPKKSRGNVHIIAVKNSSDYSAAIRLGEKLGKHFNIMSEGGARNVARRDGMGTSVLEYAHKFGKMPTHYVQAIGSGTGGIAAYEASLRLRDDGGFGDRLTKLHLVQNSPVTLIHDAWKNQQRKVRYAGDSYENSVELVKKMYADVLANMTPPYALVGGVFDALQDSDGETYAVVNDEAVFAKNLFEEVYGVTINEPAACALAGLQQAVASGTIKPSEDVLLNITGGGYELIKRDFELETFAPEKYLTEDISLEKLASVNELFQ